MAAATVIYMKGYETFINQQEQLNIYIIIKL